MTLAMMITSSPEDLNSINQTLAIIQFVKNIAKDNSHIDVAGLSLSNEDLNNLDNYFSQIYDILSNPGMNEEDYTYYESSKED